MPKRVMQGVVVSDKQDKTVTVLGGASGDAPALQEVREEVEKVRGSRRSNAAKEGDEVFIRECPPCRSVNVGKSFPKARNVFGMKEGPEL
jgi:small subunit ribosomal protein S17